MELKKYKSYFVLDKKYYIKDVYPYTPVLHIKEAVIKVEEYSKILIKEFKECISKYKDKNFKHYSQLLFLLNKDFNKYNIKFTDNPIFKNNSEFDVGIEEMKTNRLNLQIIIICNISFLQNFQQPDSMFLFTFESLLKHELVHRGQALRTSIQKVQKIYKNESTKKDKLISQYRNKGYSEEDIVEILYKDYYLGNKRELMFYSKQALEELRFSGYTDKEILNKIRLLDFHNNKESDIIFIYLNAFPDYNINTKQKNIIKLFFKYMYLYITNSGNELTQTMRI